jgi:2-oxoisovalerate dehydrogenase E1 component
VVVQEDSETCSFGQTVIQKVASDERTWGSLYSAPQLVSKPDVHIGFNPTYEYAALPDTERVVSACRKVMAD